MAQEASIVERLEELRRWQVEQQERLLLEQQEQREMLSREQGRMYQALGLSIQVTSPEKVDLRQLVPEDKEEHCFNGSSLGVERNSPTKHYEQMLKEALGDVAYTQHVSPQRRHELLHGQNQSLFENPNDTTDIQSVSQLAPWDTLAECAKASEKGQEEKIETNNNELFSKELKNSNKTEEDYRRSASPSSNVKTQLDVPAIGLNTSKMNSIGCNKYFKGLNREMSMLNADFDSKPLELCSKIAELSIEGIEPLPIEKPFNKQSLIDDMPVPSPRKDFQTLLEERLRDCGAVPETSNLQNDKKKLLVKKPFLKKGHGLARFRINSTSKNFPQKVRQRTLSLPSPIRSDIAKPDPPTTRTNSVTSKTTKKTSVQRKGISIPSTAQNKLNLRNVNPPMRTRSKSMSLQFRQNDNRLNNSDIESKTKRELEEVRIFELLEEKAENSSFCSTSSTVVALLQHSVQSTPLKQKNTRANSLSIMQQKGLKQNQKQDNIEESLLAEIVRTTKSNLVAHASSNDDDRPFRDGLPLRDTKSLSIVGNSLNSRNNDKSSKQQQQQQYDHPRSNVIDVSSDTELDQEERFCELPYGTDVDLAYDADYSKADEIDKDNENFYHDQGDEEKRNVSLHVRFAEYNEYKTLTDTSTVSTESETTRQFSDERAWSDCSATTDSSDVEQSFPTRIGNQESSSKSHGRLETEFRIDANDKGNEFQDVEDNFQSKQFALRTKDPIISGKKFQDQTRSRPDNIYSKPNPDYDSENEDYESLKTKTNGQYLNDDSNDDNEKQSKVSGNAFGMQFDEEQNELVDKIAEEGSEMKYPMENEISAIIDSTLTNVEEDMNGSKVQEETGMIFKSELLKTRLLELEREIDIFRKENTSLATQREKLQEERKRLEKQFKEKENNFEERKKRMETALQEERKKLSREKAALENRLKDAHVKAQQSKQERLEVQALKDQLEELREEMNQKEGRWNAAQARHRSQVRILQTENSKLKQELERLETLKRNQSKVRNLSKANVFSNTKAMHRINNQLEIQKKIRMKQDSSSDEEERMVEPMMEALHEEDPAESQYHRNHGQRNVEDGSKIIVYDKTNESSKSLKCPLKKKDLYDNLLKDATIGLQESEEAAKKAMEEFDKIKTSSLIRNEHHPRLSEKSSMKQLKESLGNGIVDPEQEHHSNEMNSVDDSHVRSVARTDKSCRMVSENIGNSQDNGKVNKNGIREVVHPDGRREFWLPNGNVKKVSPDGTTTKIIYYNGDVRESKEDGSVKYFYAATRTWHTTMPDGLQILEFPDGQVERRSKNGAIEVSFPDGSVRTLQSDGSERWALPDGTVAETSADGDKILILPNGQREVHTKDHKRREYPDGTVKLVYMDGSQETRYANGRIRLKDKDGNLIMDSHNE